MGQLALILLGVGLIVGGLTIATVRSTTVFVPEDLEFMGTSAETLKAANERLPSLIAHDRAGFGGALLADGLALLTMALWGFRRGARWVWWTITAAGFPGMAGAIGIHLSVGYLDFWHLSPALLALGLYVIALVMSSPFLCESGAERQRSEIVRLR